MSYSAKVIKATQEEHDAAIALMRTFMCSDKPKVGVFWYDFVNNSLFGVEKGEVDIYLTCGFRFNLGEAENKISL